MRSYPQKLQRILQQYPQHTIVGVTGHIDLSGDTGIIRQRLADKLAEIRSKGTPILLLCGMASGADQLTAACLLERDVLVALDPLPPDKEEARSFIPRYRIPLYEPDAAPVPVLHAGRQYALLGSMLVQFSHVLLALWDGVDNGAIGHTSDTVAMWLKERTWQEEPIKIVPREQQLCQLIVPREKNHFPIGRLLDSSRHSGYLYRTYDWVITTKTRPAAVSWLGNLLRSVKRDFGWCLIGLFLLAMLVWLYLRTGFKPEDDLPIIILLSAAFAGGWLLYHQYKEARLLLLQFVYPVSLAVLVLVCGTYGARESFRSPADRFFYATNLITLGAAVFERSEVKVNHWLHVGRLLGIMLAAYAFILAFALAVGKENISRLHFWFFRTLSPERSFKVVMGDSVKALYLAMDLEKNGQWVVLLDGGKDPGIAETVRSLRIWYFKGRHSAGNAILRTWFWKAGQVYLLYENDEDNFRAAREIDEIFSRKAGHRQDTNDSKWYVHQQNGLQRALLQQFTRRYIHTFSLNESIARRLLTCHPVDRFPAQRTADVVQVIMLGFNELSSEIVLNCIRQGIYTPGRKLAVHVYFNPAEEPQVNAFTQAHPELFAGSEPFVSKEAANIVQAYTFGQDAIPVVSFSRLPQCEAGLTDPAFSLYQCIQPGYITTIYASHTSGLGAAGLLGLVLPRIHWLQQGNERNGRQSDVQVHCFHNFPDINGEAYVQTRLNSLAPNLPVFCFGNYLHECTAASIGKETINRLARRIALLYACLYADQRVMPYLPKLRQITAEAEQYVADQLQKHGALVSYNQQKQQVAVRLLSALLSAWPSELDAWAADAWQRLEQDERESNLYAADHAWVKLRLLNKPHPSCFPPGQLPFYWEADELKLLAEVEHRRWNAEKLTLGWLPYQGTDWKAGKAGLKKQKLHEHLVPFNDLPDAEKDKDYTQVIGMVYLMR
jgi:hypothetical protein